MISLYLNPPFQTSCSIITDCNTLATQLLRKHGSYIANSSDPADLQIQVLQRGNSFELRYSGATYGTSSPLEEIDRILFENTKYNDDIFALHGAAVGWRDRAYLFLAPTTSGKTTLASYLTSQGFGYITDDCILLDRRTFQVYPYHTPIHLRDGGLEVLKQYGAVPNNLQLLGEGFFRRYVYTPDNCVIRPIALAQIFFITRTGSENKITEMTINERMVSLMKSPITNYPMTYDYIKFVSLLAKHTCKHLFYFDMDFVVDMIQAKEE